jgi:hypothetical protein
MGEEQMTIRQVRRAFAQLGMVVALGVTAVACEPPADFYSPPASLPPRPGDVIATVATNFGTNPGVTSTAIKYRSTTATGRPNYMTGTLLVPMAAWSGPGPRPIVGFAPGTQGLGDGCAVSKSIANSLFYEAGNVQALLDRGWAVAVTDYEGIGTAGDHTYVVKDAEAHAVLDLVGVAAGGIPADLNVVSQHLNTDGNFWFTFLSFAAVGLNAAYPDLDLDSYLNQAGRDLLAQGRNACLIDGLLLGTGKHIEDLTTTNPLDTLQWQARINQQKLGNVAPQVPVFAYHGTSDQVIPYTQATALRDAWCARRTKVQWKDYLFADHILGEFVATTDVTTWLNARFTNQPLTPTCNT